MPRALGYKAGMEARDERIVKLARANTQRAAYQLRLATAHKERMMAKRDRALLAAYYAGVRPFESASDAGISKDAVRLRLEPLLAEREVAGE